MAKVLKPFIDPKTSVRYNPGDTFTTDDKKLLEYYLELGLIEEVIEQVIEEGKKKYKNKEQTSER